MDFISGRADKKALKEQVVSSCISTAHQFDEVDVDATTFIH